MSLTPISPNRARPFVAARPAKAEQAAERHEERGFARDTFESVRARVPKAVESAIPYLHGATVGHEGLHIGSASHAAEEVIECGAGLAGEAKKQHLPEPGAVGRDPRRQSGRQFGVQRETLGEGMRAQALDRLGDELGRRHGARDQLEGPGLDRTQVDEIVD